MKLQNNSLVVSATFPLHPRVKATSLVPLTINRSLRFSVEPVWGRGLKFSSREVFGGVLSFLIKFTLDLYI